MAEPRRRRSVKGPAAWRASVLALGLACAAMPASLAAQQPDTTVVAGERYRAGPLHRALLGDGHRDAWTAPIRVTRLDLRTFAGGLTPLREGGSLHTAVLRFRGVDGREYDFRSVDKEVSRALPAFARGTLVHRIYQDQTSAQLPAAPVVATVLLDAAGVLNPGPRLVVLPDDAALGEFRPRFAGMLGTLELHPDEGEAGEPPFAGAAVVDGTVDVLRRLDQEGPRHRIDSRAFLRARLMDFLLGDYDRHAGQWRWAGYREDGVTRWVPIPEDRAFAFVEYDGLLPRVAAATVIRRLVRFDERYPSLLAMMSNSLDLNRRLLSELDRPAWDSVAADLQARITDAAIARAVESMPPAHARRVGAELEAELRARRDRLPQLAARFYALLAAAPEIHGSDLPDRLEVSRSPDGAVEVRLFAEQPGAATDTPYFRRTFVPGETGEVRVFLRGGADVARLTGQGGAIILRVLGGGGNDRFEDRSGGPTALYDHQDDNHFTPGPRTRVSRRPPAPPPPSDPLLPVRARRDWGTNTSLLRASAALRSHAGPVFSVGPSRTRYGFRSHPYVVRDQLRALFSPRQGRFGVEYRGVRRRESAGDYLEVVARYAALDATGFHGFGNDTPRRRKEEVLVWHRQLLVEPRWRFRTERVELSLGPTLRHTTSNLPPTSPAALLRPRGAEPLTQIGGGATLRVHHRDDPVFPRRGYRLRLGATAYAVPSEGQTGFGAVDAEAVAYVAALRGPVLALRAGGRRVVGDFPFYEAAFVGGSRSVRGYSHQRFAGDAEAHGTAELRVPLLPANLGLRGQVGLSGFLDAGRVFHRGESPGAWHTGVGGGAWFATPAGAVGLQFARGEKDRVYLRLGMPF